MKLPKFWLLLRKCQWFLNANVNGLLQIFLHLYFVIRCQNIFILVFVFILFILRPFVIPVRLILFVILSLECVIVCDFSFFHGVSICADYYCLIIIYCSFSHYNSVFCDSYYLYLLKCYKLCTNQQYYIISERISFFFNVIILCK